jgi:hypothetical protein
MTLEAMEKQEEEEKMKENKSKEENCVFFFFFFFLPFHSTTMAPKKVLFKGQMAHGVRTLFVKLLPHLLLGPERFNSNPIMLFSLCVCVQTFHPPRVQQPLPSQSRYTFQSFLMKTDTTTTTTTTIMRPSPTVDDNKTVHHDDDDDLLVISIRHFSRKRKNEITFYYYFPLPCQCAPSSYFNA